MSAQHVHSYESPAIECQEVQKSPDFWFGEGRFVLIASQKVAYRVHGDVLGRKSKVFNDLLNLQEVPRPDSEHTMDGCPIVHITDSPEDFSTFLSFIYDGFEHEPRWATVKVMILLGDKYDVPKIREEGLRLLRAWYAEDIDKWDKRDRDFFASESDHLSVASITYTLPLGPHLRPFILYHCCRLPVSRLVAGDPEIGCPPLCQADLIRTLKFKQSMPKTWYDLSLGLDTEDDLFRDLLQCFQCRLQHSDARMKLSRFISARLDTDAYIFLDLSAWPSMIEGLSICSRCKMYYQNCLRERRQRWLSHIDEHLEWYALQTFAVSVS